MQILEARERISMMLTFCWSTSLQLLFCRAGSLHISELLDNHGGNFPENDLESSSYTCLICSRLRSRAILLCAVCNRLSFSGSQSCQ